MKKLLLSSTYALGTVFITSFISNYIFYLNTSNVFGVHMAANVSFITTLVAGITLIIVGYPIHYYFQKYNIKSYGYYLLSGSIPGAALVFILKPLGDYIYSISTTGLIF